MNYWLFKSEPDTFGVDDLARARNATTAWDGVRNYQVRNFLRDAVRKGDQGFGEGNFKALFESIELDQMRRGVLDKT